jgi:predicted CXXCH cytochrome family protein
MLALAGTTLAATHPVPLEPGVDGKKCLECHKDKTEGKAVHTAIAKGCLTCHEVRVSKDVTRVKLTAVTPYKLCLTCHANKDATKIQGHVHEPAVRDCLQCHDPHSSPNPNQLLKAESGATKAENVCLQCHQTGVNVPAKGSRHAALDMGCDTCHVTHKTGASAEREFTNHLTKDAPALCADCHDPADKDLMKAHSEQPFGKADCLTCHDPHQSASPKLMRAFLHDPFQQKQCDTCHKPAKDGKVVLTADSSKEVCAMCHEEQVKKIKDAKVPHPGAQGDCTDCHSPHAGKTPGFIRPDPVNACLTCHSEIADLQKKGHVHQPAFEQSCAICHEPHGSQNPKLLRTANMNQLCLECHGPDANPVKVDKQPYVTIFDGKVLLPENYFRKVPILPIKYGAGHPTEGHPVQDVLDPTTNKVRVQINCLTCHQPHASGKPGLLVKDQTDNLEFCKTCHANGVNLMNAKPGAK